MDSFPYQINMSLPLFLRDYNEGQSESQNHVLVSCARSFQNTLTKNGISNVVLRTDIFVYKFV